VLDSQERGYKEKYSGFSYGRIGRRILILSDIQGRMIVLCILVQLVLNFHLPGDLICQFSQPTRIRLMCGGTIYVLTCLCYSHDKVLLDREVNGFQS
jgi:hypothetical protein